MIYHIKGWEETAIGQYEDGFMIAGIPTPTDKISTFEETWGEIPPALRSLWEVHGFVVLKNEDVLASLNDAHEKLCSHPFLLGTRTRLDNPPEKYECLTIANVWKAFQFV